MSEGCRDLFRVTLQPSNPVEVAISLLPLQHIWSNHHFVEVDISARIAKVARRSRHVAK